MCRHLAYLGAPRTLHDLIVAPEHGLYHQSYRPRFQRHGTVNADGFGAGWYLPGRPEPVRYRRAEPIWADRSFASLAPTIASGCVLAAVRSATPGSPTDESCAAPFTHGRWLFSHNGAAPAGPLRALARRLDPVPDALAPADSAVLFGLTAHRWRSGDDLAGGLARTVTEAADAAGGRLTVLATDGRSLAGVTWGEDLYLRRDTGGVLLAAEPDGTPGWDRLPDRAMVTVTGPDVMVRPVTPESDPTLEAT